MANKIEYIDALREAIWNMHGCRAHYLRTEHVREEFQGKAAWEGDVEVFALTGHPKAKHAYAWAHLDGPNDSETRFVAVLEMPPVESAKTAVQAAIIAHLKKAQS